MSAEWVVAIITLLTVAVVVTKLCWKRFRAIDDFLVDWKGTPERPGVEGRRGVMERLKNIEDLGEYLKHEVSYNSGHSLKDTVHRIDLTVQSMNETSEEHVHDSSLAER